MIQHIIGFHSNQAYNFSPIGGRKFFTYGVNLINVAANIHSQGFGLLSRI